MRTCPYCKESLAKGNLKDGDEASTWCYRCKVIWNPGGRTESRETGRPVWRTVPEGCLLVKGEAT